MEDVAHPALAILLGCLRQLRAQGDLHLTQAGGLRTLRWREGCLVGLRGDAAQEVAGPGETPDALQERLLARALSEPVRELAWEPRRPRIGAVEPHGDLRTVIWGAFQRVDRRQGEGALVEHGEVQWAGCEDLLEALGDLPITPALAYAASRLGTDPLGLDAVASLTGLPRSEAARLVLALWALGHLRWMGPLPFEVEAPGPDTVPPEEGTRLRATPHAFAGESAAARSDRALDLWVEAQAYAKDGRTSEAVRTLEEALRWGGDGPDAYEPWLLLGRLRLGNPAWAHRAMEALRAAARVNPRATEPWVLMGGIYRAKGLRVNAEGCYRRAQRLDPRVEIPLEEVAPTPPAEPLPWVRQWIVTLQARLKARQGS